MNLERHKHQDFMQKCLKLAEQGLGKTLPNPMVGSILVRDGKIIAEGFHRQHGEDHAEAAVFKSLKTPTLQNDTLYISLEPCSHTNKLTPPCLPLILNSPIENIVIGSADPNPSVAEKLLKL